MAAGDALVWLDRTPTPARGLVGSPVSISGGLIVPKHGADFGVYVPGEYALLGPGGWNELIANLVASQEAWKRLQQGGRS